MNNPGVEIRTLMIEDRECGGRADQTILEVAEENGIFIPTLCRLAGPEQHRRLPHVPGRGEGQPQTDARLRHHHSGGHGSHGELAAAGRVSQADPGDAVQRTQPHLLGVRHQRPLRPAIAGAEAGRQPHHHALPASPDAGGRLAPALHRRPQPLHPVHALRAGVPGGGRRAHLGRDGPRHQGPRHHRPEPSVGRERKLHRLRQVRAGVPHGRAERKGPGRRRDAQAPRLPALPEHDAGGGNERSDGARRG